MAIAQRAPFVLTALSLGISVASGTYSEPALGADVFEEVIVTARRREQDVQDVPLYIQTLSEEDLRESMAKGFEDYARDLTSVSFVLLDQALQPLCSVARSLSLVVLTR